MCYGDSHELIYDSATGASNTIDAMIERLGTYGEILPLVFGGTSEQSNIDRAKRSIVALINPIRYRGYYYDQEIGLYYLQSRYYDSQVGRFINADCIEYLDPETIGGLNLYAYCGNNPVMAVDPSGNAWWNPFSWNWKAIGKGIASAAAVVGGALLCVVPGAQQVGVGLIVAGSGGLVGGFASMALGGDFSSGWDIGTAIGGTIGLIIAAPQLMSVVAKIALPTLGMIGAGGAAVIGATGAIAVSIPVGALAIGASAIGLGYLFAKTIDPDPHRRPGQKKQGSELKNNSRKGDSWQQRNGRRRGPQVQKKHTPGKDHRKYFQIIALGWIL